MPRKRSNLPEHTTEVGHNAASTDEPDTTMPPADTPVATAPVPPVPIESLAARAKRLKRELDETLAEIVAQRRILDDQLAELGYVGNAVFQPPKPLGMPNRAIHKGDSKNPCKVCGEMGHDARSHRKENLAKLARTRK